MVITAPLVLLLGGPGRRNAPAPLWFYATGKGGFYRMAKPFHHEKNHDPLFLRHFRAVVTLVAGLTLALSLSMFFCFERLARQNAYGSATAMLSQAAEFTADLVDICTQVTLQIQEDNTISPILMQSSPTNGETMVALDQLSQYQYIIQSIQSIYIINNRTGKAYTSCGIEGTDNRIIDLSVFPDQSALSLVEHYENYHAYTAIPRQYGGENYYTFMGYDFSHKGTEGDLNCAVLVNVSADWLESPAASHGQTGSGETVIVTAGGTVISDSENYPMRSDAAALLPSAGQILGAETGGYRIYDGQFIAYTAPDKMGWQYLWIIPYAEVTEGIRQLELMAFILIAGFLLAGFAASWLLNRRLYRPIDQFKADITKLQSTQRENFPALKQAFFRRLLSEAPPDRETLRRELARYSSRLDPAGTAMVMLIRVDHSNEFENENTPEDASLARYAILNIACELLGTRCTAEGVDLRRSSMAVILTFSKYPPPPEGFDVFSHLTAIRDTVARYLFLSVSLAISEPGPFEQLPTLFLQAEDALVQRLFTGPGSVLAGKKQEYRDYPYSEKKEKALSDALLRGNLEKAKAVYLDLIEGFRGAPLYILNTTVLRLVSMCNQLAAGIPQLKGRTAFFINFGKIESFSQLHETFYGIFSAITACTASGHSLRSEQQVEAVNQEIERRFSDPGLSIESIAETLGLSASYTGRIYKQATGRTILERILEVRMEKARQMLKESDAPVAVVSERCGFSSDSYFYKIFKQENGVTPAAYRKKS